MYYCGAYIHTNEENEIECCVSDIMNDKVFLVGEEDEATKFNLFDACDIINYANTKGIRFQEKKVHKHYILEYLGCY